MNKFPRLHGISRSGVLEGQSAHLYMDCVLIRNLLENDEAAPEKTKSGKEDKRRKSMLKKLVPDPMHKLNRTTGKLTKVKSGNYYPMPEPISNIPVGYGWSY